MKIKCAIVSTLEWLWGRGDQPQPCHTWSGSLIADMFQEDLEEGITKAVVLAPGEAILFFGWWSLKEGLPLGNSRDVRFSLTGPVNGAGRTAQVEATANTVQEGLQATVDAVVEKRTKARGPGHSCGMMKATWAPAAAYNIEEWMQGLEEDAPEGEVRKGDVDNCRLEQRNTHSQCAGWGSRQHRWQGRPWFPRDISDGSPSSGQWSNQGNDWSS